MEPGTDTTAYGAIVPDLPGCFSVGDALDEATSRTAERLSSALWRVPNLCQGDIGNDGFSLDLDREWHSGKRCKSLI
jgi:hypothetical protein